MRGLLVALCLTLPGAAVSATAAQPSYSPPANHDHPTRVFWGDTHVHTSYSTGDAFVLGANAVTPETAYRFARGETVTARNGMQAQIRRPLDFLVIADHSEGLGLAYELRKAEPTLDDTAFGTRLRAAYQSYAGDSEGRRTVWQKVVARADEFNDPGAFTAFAGYEWSSGGTRQGVFGNLHRVVVFRDSADRTGRITPFSSIESRNPEDLWKFLERYEADTGGQVIAIPHNPNLSNGEMFALTRFDGGPLDVAWATARARFEPLVEVTQLKGDSETHPVLSPTDEFADFERWNSWAGKLDIWEGHTCCGDRQTRDFTAERFREQKQGEYARAALGRGLAIESDLGINPYRFGMIGATDTHTSLASADNDNFWGQYPNTPPSGTRPTDQFSRSWKRPLHWETSASGYAGVWAQENTRESLFAAMKRKEVYATTGPRMVVRFFGGFAFDQADAAAPDIAAVGYAKGVPMGGDLRADSERRAPVFLIGALRDPDSANLDRIQVVKGWLDDKQKLHERVFDVALADERPTPQDGDARPVGSTVDVDNASYTNAIGDPQLTVAWRDPEFDAAQPAFYYVRVLEIPTPRWPAYEAKYFSIESLPDEVVMVSQERAYTSPIWYSPK